MGGFELPSGQRVWGRTIAGFSTPGIAGEGLFVVTDDARLVAIARGTGKVRWISQLRGFRNTEKKKNAITWVGPVLAGNRLWLSNSQGELVSVSPVDGSVGATIEGKEAVSLSPVVAGGVLYTLSDKGVITAYR